MLSLPLTLVILAIALGGLVAAGVPLLLALTGVLATMALSPSRARCSRSTATSPR